MPTQLKNVQFQPGYRTGQSDLVKEFYIPCFANSNYYDRAVGYFRSSIFLLINHEIPSFVKRGGKIRIICSPYLTTEDFEALKLGYKNRQTIIETAISNEVEGLLSSKEFYNKLEALSTLIALNILDVKIAFRHVAQGMYHEKLGLFKDAYDNVVSFVGSANETWNAWHDNGNYESIEVFCSWNNLEDEKRVNRHSNDFTNLWEGKASGVNTYNFPQAVRDKLIRIAQDDIEKIKWDQHTYTITKPAKTPVQHQLLAIENWKKNNYRGILQHATGSGKTFIAIIAIKEHVQSKNPVLVLVPSVLLLKQWDKELIDEIPELLILKAGDDNNKWKSNNLLRDFTINDTSLQPRIVLSTIRTAATDLFQKHLVSGQHLMIVIDEVHQSGSRENSKVLSISAGKKLGLSATPIRYGDPEGTKLILDYFGGIIEPVVSLADAINSGRLVPYEYFPHKVNLSREELDNWDKQSKIIYREIAKSQEDTNGKKIINDSIKMLFYKRSRIPKKASSKVQLAYNIIKDNYEKGHRWLIYCEDSEQLNEILEIIKKLNLPVIEYHTAMISDMHSSLEWFKKHGGIIISVRCLDEGVDIPDITHALILASSQNPRQFIQRRGRILRKSQTKQFAILHDAIVIPPNENEADEYLSIIRSELCRAIEFSKGAINKSSSIQLYHIAIELGMDIEDLSKLGFEEDE